MAEHRSAAWRWWELYGDGITDPEDPRLVTVPSIAGRSCRLHWAAAAVFRQLAADWTAAHPGDAPLLLTSGWRERQPWQATEATYHAELLRRYRSRLPDDATDAEVIRHGRLYLARRSTHFTGLALDLGSPPPMRPDSRWVATQRLSNVCAWLAEEMRKRGLRWYLPEPWHLELPLPADVWKAAGPEG